MSSPRNLLTARKLLPKKHLGQNFLSDPSTAEMIVRRSGLATDEVALEIGAGLGALTLPIARSAKVVYAVEKDKDLVDILRTSLAENRVENVFVIPQNILDVDIAGIAEQEGSPLVVFGNLPYNISSQILIFLINCRHRISRAVLMLQKEMAQRIIAGPGGKAYGRLSVRLQYCADVRKVADVRSNMFYPRPKVDSEVIEIRFRSPVCEAVADEALFSNVIRIAFGKRRKILRNTLSKGDLGIDDETIRKVFEETGIDGMRRAETLTVEEFVRLTNAIYPHTAGR